MTICKVHTGNWREKCLTCIWWLKYKPNYWESWKPQLQSRKASQCLPETADSSRTTRRAALDRILLKSYQMGLISASICSVFTASHSLLLSSVSDRSASHVKVLLMCFSSTVFSSPCGFLLSRVLLMCSRLRCEVCSSWPFTTTTSYI